MKVNTPVLGAQATVAETAEGAEFDSTDTVVTFQEDSIVKFAGANIINVELIRSLRPIFLRSLLRELAASYAQKTDQFTQLKLQWLALQFQQPQVFILQLWTVLQTHTM
jgi:hypothetical protein